MAIVTEISWDDLFDGKPLPEHPTRTAWRAAVAEVAEKAKATLPACNGRVMDTIKSWRIALVAFSLLLICISVWPVAAMAEGRFTCRARALRVDLETLLGSLFLEPVVANPPEDPCMTDNNVLLSVDAGVVSAEVLVADTEDQNAPVTAESFALSANIPSVGISAEVLEALAQVKSVNGHCVLSGQSSVASAVVQGMPITVGTAHLHISIPGVGTLHFNETLLEPNRITQRALWLEINNPFVGEEVVVGEAIADFEGGNPCAEVPPPVDKRRMTGGGKFTNGTTTVTHGFVLHCNVARLPNNLEVNWGGNKFHLESLTSAACSDNPNIDPGQPPAGFDTYVGRGTGRFNGAPGAKAEWTFTDAGEPGSNDSASIRIKDQNGITVLNIASTLIQGNHQAHGE